MNLFEEDQTLKLMASFKPAEIEFLIYPKRDLKKKFLQADKKAPVRELIIVETGENFSSYQCKHNFEKYFLYRIDEESYYFIIPLLKAVYKDIPSAGIYRRTIRESHSSSYLYKKGLWVSVFNRVVHNEKGHKLRLQIKNKLHEIDAVLVDFFQKETQKAIHILEDLKGNVFLLENLTFEYLNTLKFNLESFKDVNVNSVFCEFLLSNSFELLAGIFDKIDDYFDLKFFTEVDSGYESGAFIDYY